MKIIRNCLEDYLQALYRCGTQEEQENVEIAITEHKIINKKLKDFEIVLEKYWAGLPIEVCYAWENFENKFDI